MNKIKLQHLSALKVVFLVVSEREKALEEKENKDRDENRLNIYTVVYK